MPNACSNETHLHVIPTDDLIDHESSELCVCGPTAEEITSGQGYGWLLVHHSLDGRELAEEEG